MTGCAGAGSFTTKHEYDKWLASGAAAPQATSIAQLAAHRVNGKSVIDSEGFIAGGTFFAPWVRELQMQVTAVSESSLSCHLPNSDHLRHGFGWLCGQAMQAAADTAFVLAVARIEGISGTLQSNMTFLKPVTDFDLNMEVRLVKVSKSQVYGTVDFVNARKDGDIVAQYTTVFGRKV